MTTKKIKKEYDLSHSAKVSSLKGYLTKAFNRQDLAALEYVKKQFNTIESYPEDSVEHGIVFLITKYIDNIHKQVPIEIKTERVTYDILVQARRKLLEKSILERAKKPDSVAALTRLKVQLDAKKITYPAFSPLNELSAMVDKLLQQIENFKKNPYSRYPTLLAEEFLPTRDHKTEKTLLMQLPSAIDKYKDDTLSVYLEKPVTNKWKTGEENFHDLSAFFWIDFLRLDNFLNSKKDKTVLYFYATAVMQLYSHNSTCYSAQGYGKVQLKEAENPLLYFRSQDKHPYIQQFSALTSETKVAGSKSTCYGLQNAYQKTLVLSILDEKSDRAVQLKNSGITGRFTTPMSANYFGPFLGYIGTRVNNVELLFSTINHTIDDKEISVSALERVLPKPKDTLSYEFKLLKESSTHLDGEFKKIAKSLSESKVHANLQSKMTDFRNHRAQKICIGCQGLDQITVMHPAHASFIYITVYPKVTGAQRELDNFKQGLVNVLMGFLGGLINHNAQVRGLHEVVQRRQSFGFMRTTITDVGSMIRLSLGLETDEFTQVIIDSIKQLNVILKKYNFVDTKKAETEEASALVVKALSPCERSRGAQVTANTGNYLRNSMRAEDDQWISLLAAQKYLQVQEREEKLIEHKPVTTKVERAFVMYINQFVVARIENNATTSPDREKIVRHGYRFKSLSTTKIVSQLAKYPVNGVEKNIVFQLLQNTIHHVVNFVLKIKSPLLDSASYQHVLIKILHNCQKGQYLLSHVDEYNISHLVAKANLLLENILEYFIVLQALCDMKNAPNELSIQELSYMREVFCIKDPNQLHLFYHDSGQQAIVAAIIAMHHQCVTDKVKTDICLFSESYYEVRLCCDEVGFSLKNYQNASVWFADITQLAELEKIMNENPTLKPHSIILDITNDSCSKTLVGLHHFLETLQKRGVWLLLVTSMLKHEEIGLDKYQLGRSVYIAPNTQKIMDADVHDKLKANSHQVLNPLIAGFRLLVNNIFNEQCVSIKPQQSSEAKTVALVKPTGISSFQQGLFKRKDTPDYVVSDAKVAAPTL